MSGSIGRAKRRQADRAMLKRVEGKGTPGPRYWRPWKAKGGMKIGALAERVRLRMWLREYNRDDNPNLEPTATEALLQASAVSRAREWQAKSALSEPQFVIAKPSVMALLRKHLRRPQREED